MGVDSKLSVSIGFIVVGIVSFFALSSMKQIPASAPQNALPPIVQTTKVRSRTEGFWLSADGEVAPYREVTISAEVAGQIKIKAPQCFAGQYVEKGTLLLQIDARDYELELQRLSELTSQAKNNVEELDVEHASTLELIKLALEDLGILRGELERITTLNRRSVATESDLDTARHNELAARNTMQTLQNQKALLEKRRGRLVSEQKRMETELQKAQLDRDRTEIRAPLDGVVTEDLVEAGAFVDRGAALVKLEDTSKVEVHFNLQFSQLQWLWQYAAKEQKTDEPVARSRYELPHLPVEVVLAVGDQQFQWRGQLARYDGSGVNAVTRTVPCVAIVEERVLLEISGKEVGNAVAPPVLLCGMFVTVRMKIEPQIPLLDISASAVRPGDELWVLRDGKLAIETVTVVTTVDGEALLIALGAPVKAGDEIITSPLPLAIDGMPLRKADSAPSPPQVSEEKQGA